MRFYLYPDLPISLISEKIANDFGLLQAGLPPFFFHVNPPFNQVMPALAGLPISGAWRVEATIKIRCPGVVAPSPARALEPFEFHIPDPTIAPPKLAVFGRNVIKRMLLLYQGQYRPVNALRNAPTKPRFYLGRNENPHI
ncbi:MAG TPA: hypothetical protein PLI09_01720 [Candidatus Hydrogenedentes bacterium]|nr:hypothetical protein [Candidatus Hydrogenedentota bacterium]